MSRILVLVYIFVKILACLRLLLKSMASCFLAELSLYPSRGRLELFDSSLSPADALLSIIMSWQDTGRYFGQPYRVLLAAYHVVLSPLSLDTALNSAEAAVGAGSVDLIVSGNEQSDAAARNDSMPWSVASNLCWNAHACLLDSVLIDTLLLSPRDFDVNVRVTFLPLFTLSGEPYVTQTQPLRLSIIVSLVCCCILSPIPLKIRSPFLFDHQVLFPWRMHPCFVVHQDYRRTLF